MRVRVRKSYVVSGDGDLTALVFNDNREKGTGDSDSGTSNTCTPDADAGSSDTGAFDGSAMASGCRGWKTVV